MIPRGCGATTNCCEDDPFRWQDAAVMREGEVFAPNPCNHCYTRVEHVCFQLDSVGEPSRDDPGSTPRHFLNRSLHEGDGSMDAIMNFLGNTWVMVGMGVALVALIGVMIFLRMKPRDEE